MNRERLKELRQAFIHNSNSGLNRLSSNDTNTIVSLIDAELAQPTDDDVERAIKFAEWAIGEAKRRKREPVAWYTILAALRAYRKPKQPDCSSAEWSGGKCCGYGKSENNDEPIDACKICPKQASYGEE